MYYTNNIFITHKNYYSRRKNILKLLWSVVKNDDIADPYIFIREVKNPLNVLYSETIPYFKRKLEIDIGKGNLTKIIKNKADFEVCILARNSKAVVRKIFKQQCHDFASDKSGNRPLFNISAVYYVIILGLTLNFFNY